MKKARLVVLVVLLTLALSVSLFATGEQEQGGDGTFTVGFSVSDITNPYWNTQVQGAQSKADEYGIELIVHDSQMDPTRELNALENWITQGVDGIMVATIDAEASAPYIDRAREAGIKVVATIHPMETEPDAFLTLDEYEFGYTAGLEAGKWIAENLPPDSKFAVLTEDIYAHVVARADGIIDGVLENAPQAQLAARQVTLNTSEAMTTTENLLQAHPDLKVIQAVNDNSAMGAYEAVRAAGRASDDFYVGGNDATPQALSLINDGTIYRMSVDINPYGSGQLEMEMMWNLLNDIDFEKVQVVPMTAVTAENVGEFIRE
jgi:ABC-type sugar transport system substrate-binding protein